MALNATQDDATYLWSDQSTTPILVVEQAGTYAVTVTNECGSSSSISEVTFVPLPEAALMDTALCEGQEIISDVTVEGGSYTWSDFSTSPIFHVDQPGLYAVTVSNACGISTASIHVDERNCDYKLYMPNVFSPDCDGINDAVGPIVTAPPLEYQLTIFDRWGNQVFVSIQYQATWDGRFKGIPSPPGVYAYSLRAWFSNEPEKELKGNITLLR